VASYLRQNREGRADSAPERRTMARPPTGQIIERQGKHGRSFGIRFRACGRRHYLTLDVATRADAETELKNVLADVRRGIWKPPAEPVIEGPQETPTFHAYASQWHAARKGIVKPRTSEWEKWALSGHLLPVLAARRVNDIDAGAVRAYIAAKQAEGVLSARSSTQPSASSLSCSQRPSRTTCWPSTPSRGGGSSRLGSPPAGGWSRTSSPTCSTRARLRAGRSSA
jgi:hypothetical protein